MRKSLNQQFNSDQQEKNRDGQYDRVYVQCFLFICIKFSNMTLKLFRAVWFLSVLVVLANLLYVYASLPEQVVISEADRLVLSREWLFYIVMVIIVGINLLVYLFKMLYERGENLRSWFHGLVITINLFLIVAMQALNVYNSHEFFDHGRVGFYITGSLALILLWAAFWPAYLFVQKILVKQAV